MKRGTVKEVIEYASGLCFGIGIGAGILAHYREVGIACFILAGIGWLVASSIKEEQMIIKTDKDKLKECATCTEYPDGCSVCYPDKDNCEEQRVEILSGESPCNYTSGGLFCFNPIRVIDGDKTLMAFAFDEDKEVKE